MITAAFFENENRYKHYLAAASPAQLELAMRLQRIAFHNQREYPPTFTPAPLYLDQAMAISSDAILAGKLMTAIEDAVLA